MALIENLEHEGWEKFFRDSFRYALDVLLMLRGAAVLLMEIASGI